MIIGQMDSYSYPLRVNCNKTIRFDTILLCQYPLDGRSCLRLSYHVKAQLVNPQYASSLNIAIDLEHFKGQDLLLGQFLTCDHPILGTQSLFGQLSFKNRRKIQVAIIGLSNDNFYCTSPM